MLRDGALGHGPMLTQGSELIFLWAAYSRYGQERHCCWFLGSDPLPAVQGITHWRAEHTATNILLVPGCSAGASDGTLGSGRAEAGGALEGSAGNGEPALPQR